MSRSPLAHAEKTAKRAGKLTKTQRGEGTFFHDAQNAEGRGKVLFAIWRNVKGSARIGRKGSKKGGKGSRNAEGRGNICFMIVMIVKLQMDGGGSFAQSGGM